MTSLSMNLVSLRPAPPVLGGVKFFSSSSISLLKKLFLISNGFSLVTVIIFVLEENHGEEKTHKTSSILPGRRLFNFFAVRRSESAVHRREASRLTSKRKLTGDFGAAKMVMGQPSLLSASAPPTDELVMSIMATTFFLGVLLKNVINYIITRRKNNEKVKIVV